MLLLVATQTIRITRPRTIRIAVEALLPFTFKIDFKLRDSIHYGCRIARSVIRIAHSRHLRCRASPQVTEIQRVRGSALKTTYPTQSEPQVHKPWESTTCLWAILRLVCRHLAYKMPYLPHLYFAISCAVWGNPKHSPFSGVPPFSGAHPQDKFSLQMRKGEVRFLCHSVLQLWIGGRQSLKHTYIQKINHFMFDPAKRVQPTSLRVGMRRTPDQRAERSESQGEICSQTATGTTITEIQSHQKIFVYFSCM